jgi:hypothetical protein
MNCRGLLRDASTPSIRLLRRKRLADVAVGANVPQHLGLTIMLLCPSLLTIGPHFHFCLVFPPRDMHSQVDNLSSPRDETRRKERMVIIGASWCAREGGVLVASMYPSRHERKVSIRRSCAGDVNEDLVCDVLQ